MKKKYLLLILFLYLLLPNNVFGTFQFDYDIDPGVRFSSIALGDIDNDGDLDLVLSGETNALKGITSIYENDNTGNFNFLYSINFGVYRGGLALEDIDNDNDLDLILTGNINILEKISKIYKNNGNGIFSFYDDIDSNVRNSYVALGDIDNDGDKDLILTGVASGRITKVYKNNGNGDFIFYSNIDPGVSDGGVVLGDIDNDGDLDLAFNGLIDAVNRTSKIFTNNGNGDFIYKDDIGVGVKWSSIAIGDIDSDNDLDLIQSGYNSFEVYTNDSNGNFGLFSIIIPIIRDCSIALGDIDNDGDLDLIACGSQFGVGNKSKVYKNNGNGNFIFHEDISPAVNYSSIALGDIDNDRTLDIILTGYTGSTRISKVYKNTNSIINNPPSIPDGLKVSIKNNFWRFQWDQSSDDHTFTNIIRYQIAIGTNTPSNYEYVSPILSYPRGQANIGNVPSSNFYQSEIPYYKTCYWKVKAIDSGFISS